MKELSIEEKAKRYDEAIEKFDVILHLNTVKESGTIFADDVRKILPELKESEDERIRKNCIHFLELQKQHHAATFEIEECIDWLEKQGNTDSIIEKAKTEKQRVIITETDGNANIDWDTRSLEDARRLLECGLQYINTELEKQGEQSKEATYTHEVVTGNGNIKALVTEKVQLPKFEIGDLITNGILVGRVDAIHKRGYHAYFGDHYADVPDAENWHKWTIQDAKDGDVLLSPGTPEGDKECPFIFKEIEDGIVRFHVALLRSEKLKIADGITNVIGYANAGYHIPATKEQRDLLFQKMREEGYEWDAEKKKLKKIEQKPAWSEDDENLLKSCSVRIQMIDSDATLIDWLVFIKYRIQPQPKQEWSEEDGSRMDNLCHFLEEYGNQYYGHLTLQGTISWLKSLRPQPQWKPSDEQMEALERVCIAHSDYRLWRLLEQLKNLTE